MADLITRDHIRELWMQIDQLHLRYLQSDDSPYKLDQRSKLEEYIMEYLCIVSHDRKFCFRETADILYKSAKHLEDFSAYKAGSAWEAISTYAANLLSKPWRKEYRELKLYCGYYKHEVEPNLFDAELMLEAMGYKHTDQYTMLLEGPIDPDRVSNVSRDSLMAYVECKLLKRIWEEVSRRFRCSWLEVLEYRQNHAGTPEYAAKGLIYRFHQLQFQELQQQQQHQQIQHHHHPVSLYQSHPQENYGTTTRFHQPVPQPSGCIYGAVPALPHMGYNYYSPYLMGTPHAYTLPPQARYATAMSPHQAIPPTMQYPIPTAIHPSFQSILKPQELYASNNPLTLHQYQVPVQMPPMTMSVPYTTPNQHIPVTPQLSQPFERSVPTAQLIDVDTVHLPLQGNISEPPTFSATDSLPSDQIHQAARNSTFTQNHESKSNFNSNSHETNHKRLESTPHISHKAEDDGKGTFDSWDYVFRNLESQGYSKDLSERPSVLNPANGINNSGQKTSHKESKPSDLMNLEETLMELRLEEYNRKMAGNSHENRTLKINEALQKYKEEENSKHHAKKLQGNDMLDSRASVYDNMSSPPREVLSMMDTNKSTFNAGTLKSNAKSLLKDPLKLVNKKLLENNGNSKISQKPSLSRTDSNIYITSPTTDTSFKEKAMGIGIKGSSKIIHKEPRKFLGKKITQITGTNFSSDDYRKPSIVNNSKENKSDARENEVISKWSCATCTYLNPITVEICEMCGKSKVKGPEVSPLTSGGRQCPTCTLVNEKGVTVCAACSHSLKDSPTYI